MPRSVQEQVQSFRQLLEGKSFEKKGKIYQSSISWLREFEGIIPEVERKDLHQLVARAFNVSVLEVDSLIVRTSIGIIDESLMSAHQLEKELNDLIPQAGYFRSYVDFTMRSEAPLAYHFFCAFVGLAAVVNRRVFLEMGYFRIYPPMGVILLGPSGLKKTSASDIIVNILQELSLTNIYSEKLTPEALIEGMKGENATGLIYAPEMAVFLSKQKYMEGIVPLITRFMDCPAYWESGTIGRGKTKLTNVAISSLMCSTVDWFINNTPVDMFGGGFIARNLLIVQNDSPRVEPIPIPGDPTIRDQIKMEMAYLHSISGEMIMAPDCFNRYDTWYRKVHKEQMKDPEHEMMGTYYQRKPTHLLRVAMCLHLGQHGDLIMCEECFDQALAIINWSERFLPAVLQQMFKTPQGEEAERVIRTIKSLGGGPIQHTTLLRKLQYRMDGQRLKSVLGNLVENGTIIREVTTAGQYYTIGTVGGGKK